MAPPAAPALKLGVQEPHTLESFFKVNKYFAAPWIILNVLLFAMHQVPQIQAYFDSRGLQSLGIVSAIRLAVWPILCSFALHGWLAVNHDDIMHLKIVNTVPYDWKSGDSSIRCSMVFFFGMLSYAFVPMRIAAETWAASIQEFLVGYAILLILGDAWFFIVHLTFHSRTFYQMCHKTHHRWKYPVCFASYYITSGTHFIQEHLLSIPCVLFLPVPCSSFLFWQYYGTPVAMMQHCGFSLEKLHVPFCAPLKIGHLLSVCGLGFGYILGSQSPADHDYHHEQFHGNFQLSYTYLDRLFGYYVECSKKDKSDSQEPLLSA